MKKIILGLACLFPLALMAQGGYTITGKIPGLNGPAKIYLATVQNGAFRDKDSVETTNGEFKFQGQVKEPEQAILAVKRLNSATAKQRLDQLGLFIENSRILISTKDSIKNAAVSGSVSDRENRELEASIRPLTSTIMKLNNQYGKAPKDEARQKASDSVMHLVARIKAIHLNFAASHLNSFMGLYVYNIYVLDSHFDPAEVGPLFNKFSTELESSELGKRTLAKIEAGRRGQKGITVTDFTQQDMNGKPFTLSSLRGKYVLIDFWASWCGPCRAENPNVRKAYQQLKDKNFEIVSVSLDSGKPEWVAAIHKDGMPWIHVSDLKGWKNEVALMYGVNAVPQNLLIDPKGMIIAKNLRGDDLTEKLSALIK